MSTAVRAITEAMPRSSSAQEKRPSPHAARSSFELRLNFKVAGYVCHERFQLFAFMLCSGGRFRNLARFWMRNLLWEARTRRDLRLMASSAAS
ncbi:protein of unknown function [Bradyrhizobium vignae]|uniref:Uncharacterized protein n=1 Tax=Bradyrhizobium vignae TaxID=1549949 RepID=A0A2U3Q8W3_9BRAD|nr:protein of unknown function [Bradyrhizobium vignae]